MTGGTALAQSAPAAREKGPLVWLDMDQKELDDAYDQAVYAPNAAQLHKRRQAQQRGGARAPRRAQALRLRLDPDREARRLHDQEPNAPINVFIHGGAWRSGDCLGVSATPAELFVHAGAHFVVLDFINVIKAGGNLMPMAEQVRRAIAWVHKNAASFGGDPNRIYVSGHSSGAHLAGVTLITDWPKDFGVPTDVIKGALLSSGHVRSQAGAAVEARRLREVHRRDGRGAVHAAPPRRASTAR